MKPWIFLITLSISFTVLFPKDTINMPYFQSREDYILWELSDKGYFSDQLYYKFFPHFKEKRIGDWKTIPSNQSNPNPLYHKPSGRPLFKVRFFLKKEAGFIESPKLKE